MAKRKLEVAVKNLRWRCNQNWFPADRTDQIKPTEEIIGQDRALEAIETGLGIKSHGYNIYVAGLTGTGKMTTIEKLLEQIDSNTEIPGDICYVHNFNNPNRSIAIHLKAGQGNQLSEEMDQMIEELSKIIPGIEENEQFELERKTLIERYKQKNQSLFQKFEKALRSEGLALLQVQMGEVQRPAIFPIFENEVIQWDKLVELVETKKISQEKVDTLRQKHDEFMEKLEDTFQLVKILENELSDKIETLQVKFIKPSLDHWKRTLKGKFEDKKIHLYFNRMFKYLTEHLDDFTAQKEVSANQMMLANLASMSKKSGPKDPFLIYRVNVLVDNSEFEKPPIVIETAPNYQNLFGTIEHTLDAGGIWDTDFTKIKAGSILNANGGYLVFNFLDALSDSHVWKGLKRVLKNNQIIIQNESLPYAVSTTAIKPEPIKVNLKVLVIGDFYSYHYLYENDDEFRKIFKIRADFDTEMENSKNAVRNYSRFISKICNDENLFPLDRSGMATIVEEGVRLSGRQNMLSTRFSDIADLVRESHYWVRKNNGRLIKEEHVNKAIQARRKRLQLSEEKYQKMILEDVLLIETDGEKIGQLNGISVYDLGDYSFGKPSKITAEVGIGNSGLINIEREAELGGKIYNKGVLIISGYLNGKYAQKSPLTMNASICFEQSYSGVDGDSASSAEIFVLLSSIAEIPLRQDLAVTGSSNQKGEIQPIGGVNQKIEGVYDVCKARGFTGKQGVIIPYQNVSDLMLRNEIVKSVENGEFTIYSIKTIDEGIELLTGKRAGKRNKEGRYSANSIHGLVQKRLNEFSELMKEFDGQ